MKVKAVVDYGGDCLSDPTTYNAKVKLYKKVGDIKSITLGESSVSFFDHGNGLVINSGPYSMSLDYSQAEELVVLFDLYNKFDLFPRKIEAYKKK